MPSPPVSGKHCLHWYICFSLLPRWVLFCLTDYSSERGVSVRFFGRRAFQCQTCDSFFFVFSGFSCCSGLALDVVALAYVLVLTVGVFFSGVSSCFESALILVFRLLVCSCLGSVAYGVGIACAGFELHCSASFSCRVASLVRGADVAPTRVQHP